jgi:hypothetical protein
MVDLGRIEERKAIVGTATFIGLLLLILIIMGLMNGCSEAVAEEEISGSVSVSVGYPDDGGADTSSAEEHVEEIAPPVEEEYVPQHQQTSDVTEAPEVKKTEPADKKPTDTKPKDKPTEPVNDTKPVDTKKPDPRSQFPGSKKGDDKSGTGEGDPSKDGGYKGNPDGIRKGDPDGTGGTGKIGDGPSGTGGSYGKEGLRGFKIKTAKKPAGTRNVYGVVRLKVCVNADGSVDASSVKYAPGRDPNTTTDLTLRKNAIAALKQFKFSSLKSTSTRECGYISFTFKP